MSSLRRRVLAIVAGIVTAMAVVSLADLLIGRVFPMPVGTDVRDAVSMAAAIASMPTIALALLILGWALGTGIGAFTALISVGLIVAVVLLLATISNLLALPHPRWMWPAALVSVPLLGWLGAHAAARGRQVPPAR
jgi:hypothetical protein